MRWGVVEDFGEGTKEGDAGRMSVGTLLCPEHQEPCRKDKVCKDSMPGHVCPCVQRHGLTHSHMPCSPASHPVWTPCRTWRGQGGNVGQELGLSLYNWAPSGLTSLIPVVMKTCGPQI